MKKTILLSLLTAMSAPVLAGNFYLSGSVGQVHYTQGALTPDALYKTPIQMSSERKSIAYKAQAGYQFNDYFALEGGYVNLGKSSVKVIKTGTSIRYDSTLAVQGVNLLAVGILPLGEHFSLLGKAGLIYSMGRSSASVTLPKGSVGIETRDRKLAPTWGVGAALNLNKQFALRADYDQYRNQGVSGYRQTVDMLSLGANIKF